MMYLTKKGFVTSDLANFTMRQLLYTFSFIMVLLAVFLGVWWTQRYQSSRDTLRDQVESEMNLLISDSYLIRTFQIIRSSEWSTFGGAKYQVQPQSAKPIVMMGKRLGRLEEEYGGRTKVTLSDARNGVSEVEVIIDESGFSLANLPEDVRDSISRKFKVSLYAPEKIANFPDLICDWDERFGVRPIHQAELKNNTPVVWAKKVGDSSRGKGTMYEITEYRGTLLLGMLPEFLLGFVLFGATGFAFASAYRNLHEQDKQLRQKDALVANVAHELKTPIATVGVALEALNIFGADADPEKRKEYLAIGQAELKRLDQMADRAIDSLQAGDLSQRLQLSKTDLSDAVREAWRGLSLRYNLQEEALALTTYGDVRTNVDPHYWHHLVYNLLDNACKYGGSPPRIDVNVSGQAHETVFTITDNGPGIPPHERENVFERFYRIYRPGEGHAVKGHGLGLTFVRQVATAHGSTVEVDNSENGGARFTVKVPNLEV
ncbi:MAG: anti-sigma regulatory factor (Ser/Thr protein kinase) [Neolewinella sp.]|jgi:anti-sigma regulatory factor (Ser/Thr protein kinase)